MHQDDSFLCLCARPVRNERDRRRLRDECTGVSWPVRLERAGLHGMMGVMYDRLSRHAADLVPAAVMHLMKREASAVQVRNLRMMHELLRMGQWFHDARLPLITFKGPLLAQAYYGNLAFRQFGDIDVLVPPDRLSEAWSILQDHGYHCRRQLSVEQAKDCARADLGREFEKGGVTVEVHGQLLNRALTFRLHADAVWERATPTTMGAPGLYELAPTDLLLYLCAHGAKHHWSRLLWASDVARVLNHHPDLDWTTARQRARTIGSLRTLLLGVALAQRWFSVAVPTGAERDIRADRAVASLIRDIEANWLGTDLGLHRPAGWATLRFTLRTRQRLRDNWPMMAHYARLAVTPTENDRAFAGARVPQSVLYLLRPLRLLVDALSTLSRSRSTPSP